MIEKIEQFGKRKRSITFVIALVLSLSFLSSCGQQSPTAKTTVAATQSIVQNGAATTTAEMPVSSESSAAADTTAIDVSEPTDDRIDIPESEYTAYIDKTYEANQRKTIFNNHRYLIMDSDFNIDPGEYKADYCWLAKDVTYYKAPAYEEFSLPDVRYELLGIGSDWNPTATYYLDMIEGGYQYWPVSNVKGNWFDPEHETFTEMYIQDGRLYTASVYDEAGTEAFYGVMLPQVEYTGGIIRYYSVVDAETFEFIEASYYLEKDGVSERLFTERYIYDQPIPHCVNVIEGMFERAVLHTVTVTVTAHPGEETEITKSIVVPLNSMVSVYVPDMAEPVYYTDYECTKTFDGNWDMMSDLTLYIRDGVE